MSVKTESEIYSGMKEAFETASGLALRDGGDMAVRLYAAASEICSLYVYGEWVKRQCFPQTAEGDYLDRHGEMRGITRRAAEKAAGVLRFSVPEALGSPLTVAAGTACMTAAGAYYDTAADAVIPAGSLFCDAPAAARAAGSGGNTAAGTVVLLTAAPLGVSACTNPAAFTGGCAAETDESLRSRILSSYRSLPNGANAAYYEKEVLDVDGVAAVRVLPKNRGIGTVDVICAAEGGMPDQTLLDAVKARLDATREICVDIRVSAPAAVTADVAAALDVEDGYAFEAVKSAAETAVRTLFTGARLGCSLPVAELTALLYNVEGVRNCAVTSPAADVSVDSGSLAVLGTLTIGAWS